MSSLHDLRQNSLLAALPDAELAFLLPSLEPVQLSLGDLIYEPGVPMQYVYFPTTMLVSLQYVMQNGASAGFAVIGNEGVTGIPFMLGEETTTNWAVVQSAGHAYRLSGLKLREVFSRGGPLQRLLLRYTQARLVDIAQTSMCNRYHSLEQQLCRWLLLCLDRVPSNELIMTHELIARNLGVRREGVTAAAGKLQRAGLIEYRHGHITVLGRSGLEAQACECYGLVRREYDRLRRG